MRAPPLAAAAAALSLLSAPRSATACSAVRVHTPDGHVIARTMEVGGYHKGVDLDHPWPYVVVSHPRGHVVGGNVSSYCNDTLAWTSAYAHVTLTSDPSWVTEAMNERGLTVSGHTLQESVYENEISRAEPTGAPRLCWRDFAEWAAAMHANIPELIAALPKVSVVWQGSEGRGTRLHWIVEDGVNPGVAIEYIDGRAVVHNNTVGVFTNDPPFDWHLRNLNNYVSVQPGERVVASGMSVDSEVGSVPRVLGHGMNLAGLPGGASPPDRFVRLWYLRSVAAHNTPPRNISEGVSLAANVIAAVTIPKGAVAMPPGDANQWEFTEWTVIKVPSKRLFYFKGYGEDRWRKVDVGALASRQQQRLLHVFQTAIADAEDVTGRL